MTGDLNIRDCLWDSSYPFYSSHKDILFKIADFFYVAVSKPTEILPTRYSDNTQNSNSVLDLVFLHPNSTEHNNYHIYLEWRLISDHIPITIDIHIYKEQVQTRKQSLPKNNKEEAYFIKELIYSIKRLSTDPILNIDALETIVQTFTNNIDRIQHRHSKVVNITRYSKVWWDNNCHRDLDTYRQFRQLEDQKRFKGMVKKMKQNFFDGKIDEITNKKCSPWKLMRQVKKRSLLATKAIQFNRQPYIELDNL